MSGVTPAKVVCGMYFKDMTVLLVGGLMARRRYPPVLHIRGGVDLLVFTCLAELQCRRRGESLVD